MKVQYINLYILRTCVNISVMFSEIKYLSTTSVKPRFHKQLVTKKFLRKYLYIKNFL